MREMGLLKAMFGAAVSDRVIERNPWKGVKRLRTEARTRVLQPDEQRRLFDQFNDEYRRAFTAYLGTGLRSQELLALRRQDVQNGSILVSAQSAKFGKRRVVPLRPEVAEAIEQQARAKGRSRDERLWQQSGGAVRKYLRKSCERAQIEHLSVHDLRRTFATRCAVSGMPMATLRDIMGHASMEVTAKYYVHLRQQDLTDALAQADLNLPRPGTSPGTFAASESEVVRLQEVQEG
jgi:integrase